MFRKTYYCYDENNKKTITLEEYITNEEYPDIKIYSRDIEKVILFKIKTPEELAVLYTAWRAFCINPEKYRNIAKMVSAWFENIVNS